MFDTRTAAEDVCVEFVIDEETFRAFYERTARGVWGYLVRVTGERELADDLLQETYYRFLRAKSTHDTEEHRRNSLYCIATNLARDSTKRGTWRVTFRTGISSSWVGWITKLRSEASGLSWGKLNHC